jgi:hypothetical protein
MHRAPRRARTLAATSSSPACGCAAKKRSACGRANTAAAASGRRGKPWRGCVRRSCSAASETLPLGDTSPQRRCSTAAKALPGRRSLAAARGYICRVRARKRGAPRRSFAQPLAARSTTLAWRAVRAAPRRAVAAPAPAARPPARWTRRGRRCSAATQCSLAGAALRPLTRRAAVVFAARHSAAHPPPPPLARCPAYRARQRPRHATGARARGAAGERPRAGGARCSGAARTGCANAIVRLRRRRAAWGATQPGCACSCEVSSCDP